MKRSRSLRLFMAFIMVLSIGAGILAAQTAAFAQGASTPTPSPEFRLDCPYPALAVQSGQPFTFEVNLRLSGATKSQLFNLSTTSLDGWKVTTTAATTGKEVSAVQIAPYDDPTYPVTETIIVTLSPYTQVYPAPGEYKINFKASSDTYTKSVDLKGTVLPQYAFILTTETDNLYYVTSNSSPSISINGDKDSLFSFNVVNKGTATIENLGMSAAVPEGWKVTFNPETIPSLGFGMMQKVDATISPPKDTSVTGDFIMKFKADNGTISTAMDVRAQAVKPSFPAWVVMILIAAVVVGVAVGYQKLFNKPKSKVAAAKK